MRLQDGLYDPQRYLQGQWHASWLSELPPEYWREMVDAIATHWVSWVDPKDVPAYLETPEGLGKIRDQLVIRVSQASELFVPWLEAAVPLRGKKVLEIGGGAGASTAALARAGAHPIVVDISEHFLCVNRTRLSVLGLAATHVLAPDDWLSSDEKAREVIDRVGEVDLVVCYALIEHLLIAERLRVLTIAREFMRKRRDVKFVCWETPNRLAPVDWHTTRTVLPDVVPDELGALYLETVMPAEARPKSRRPWLFGERGKVPWGRTGRGASFHEFEVAFGPGNYRVIQDGYWGRGDQQHRYNPRLDYEAALEAILGAMNPPVPRGFCRPSLNLVIELAD